MPVRDRKRAGVRTPGSGRKAVKKRARVIDLTERAPLSPYSPEKVLIARAMAKCGATDEEIAEEIGISARTLHRWKIAHPEFMEALTVAKEMADERVVRSLYRKALGYAVEREKVFVHEGNVIKARYAEEIAPDTAAMIFWLKNREPDRWRDQRHFTGGTTAGGPAQIEVSVRVKIEERLAAMTPVLLEEPGLVIEGVVDDD